MKRPEIESLKYWIKGNNLNVFQKNDAVNEFDKLLNYVKELEKAINNTPCCKELKDKEVITFGDWLKSEGYKYYNEKWHLDVNGFTCFTKELEGIYKEEVNL